MIATYASAALICAVSLLVGRAEIWTYNVSGQAASKSPSGQGKLS